MELALAAYILTVLIPINGLIWLGMRAERQRMRKLAFTIQRFLTARRRR